MERKKTSRIRNPRYDVELGSEGLDERTIVKKNVKSEALKNDPVATGQHLTGTFTNHLLSNHAEFGMDYDDHEVSVMKQHAYKTSQKNLRPNNHVENAEENPK